MTASELAPRPYMAPKDRSISPTTMTRVSPSDMIATELIARRTEMPTSMLNDFGLRTNINRATRTIARTNPPMRNARSKVAWPVEDKLGRGVPAGAGSRESALVMRLGGHAPKEEGPGYSWPQALQLLLAEDAVEFGSRYGDLILHHRQKRLSVGQDRAVLQELGAGGAAEGCLIRPS